MVWKRYITPFKQWQFLVSMLGFWGVYQSSSSRKHCVLDTHTLPSFEAKTLTKIGQRILKNSRKEVCFRAIFLPAVFFFWGKNSPQNLFAPTQHHWRFPCFAPCCPPFGWRLFCDTTNVKSSARVMGWSRLGFFREVGGSSFQKPVSLSQNHTKAKHFEMFIITIIYIIYIYYFVLILRHPKQILFFFVFSREGFHFLSYLVVCLTRVTCNFPWKSITWNSWWKPNVKHFVWLHFSDLKDNLPPWKKIIIIIIINNININININQYLFKRRLYIYIHTWQFRFFPGNGSIRSWGCWGHEPSQLATASGLLRPSQRSTSDVIRLGGPRTPTGEHDVARVNWAVTKELPNNHFISGCFNWMMNPIFT